MNAICAAGDGPDVLVTLGDTPLVLHEEPVQLDRWIHGVVKSGSLELTADEALKLAGELVLAARSATAFDNSLAEHDAEHNKLEYRTLSCNHCRKEVAAVITKKEFKNGSGFHLRADCPDCGKFIKFVAQ